MAAYFLAAMDVTDPAGFQLYAEAAMPTFEGVNFEILSIADNPEVLEGTLPAQHFALIRFDDEAALKAWYDSEGYKKAKPIRLNATANGFATILNGLG